MKKRCKSREEKNLLPFHIIKAASEGDVMAINTVLKHYEGYIISLSTRKMYDESGLFQFSTFHYIYICLSYMYPCPAYSSFFMVCLPIKIHLSDKLLLIGILKNILTGSRRETCPHWTCTIRW